MIVALQGDQTTYTDTSNMFLLIFPTNVSAENGAATVTTNPGPRWATEATFWPQ